MFKFVFKTLLIGIILFTGSQYIKYLLTGQSPSLQTPSIEIPTSALSDLSLSNMTEKISNKSSSAEKETTRNQIYKWRDEKGVIHYTSAQPAGNVQYESIPYHKETNVVPTVKDHERIKTSDKHSNVTQTATNNTLPDNLYSPEGIKQLVNQAKDIQNQVNEAYTHQDSIINQQ